MKMTRHSVVGAVLSLAATCLVIAQATSASLITVNVRVIDSNGVPIQGICVAGLTKPRKAARTDTNGKAVLSAEVDPSTNDGAIEVVLSPQFESSMYVGQSDDQRAYDNAMKASCFQDTYSVKFESGVIEYSVQIIGKPACLAQGLLQWSDGVPIWCEVTGPSLSRYIDSDPDSGAFVLSGLERGVAQMLVCVVNADERVVFVPVSATEASGALVDVGVRRFVRKAGSCQLHLTVDNRDAPDVCAPKEPRRWTQVCVVASDMSIGYQFAVHPDGHAVDRAGNPPKIAPGEYFVFPGTWRKPCVGRKVLTCLGNGRAGDLIAAGVPHLAVASTEENVTASVSIGAVEAAIAGMPE